MNCLRCQVNMKKAERDGVLIDVCPECKGIWLDGGELDMLKAGERKQVPEILADARREIIAERSHLLQVVGMCPKCQRAHIEVTQRDGVELDVCPYCHGAFFDDGEMEQLRTREHKSFKQALASLFSFGS
jgi:hypothetical protein